MDVVTVEEEPRDTPLELRQEVAERRLTVSVEDIAVARERCAAVGKNGNNRAEGDA